MGLMKKLTSAVVTSSLVLGAVSTAFAAPAADEVNAAYARLNHYNVVQGVAMPDGSVSPALDQNITRAQLVTIVTRAFGQEENAKLLRGATTGYSDVDGNAGVEWATGYIFMGQRIAAQKGITIGLPGGVFAPSKNVSQIEALAFIMKYLGVEVGTGNNWVETTIANAKAAGLITDAEAQKYVDNANAAANRGHVFALLDNIFASYNKLEGGKTVYTTYIDTAAPELSITQPALSTDKTSIEITGSVKGEFSALYAGSQKIAANADGSFSFVAPLNIGANTVTFTVVDRAGNSDEATYQITRTAGTAAKITASLAASVAAGSATDLAFEVTDANGLNLNVPASDLQVVVAGNIGSFDATTGKFTASEKAGAGTVTVSYGELAPVTINVTVAAGNLAAVTADKTSVAKGETIQLTATDKFGNVIASGINYSVDGTGVAVTNAGVVYTSAAGKYTVTANGANGSATVTVGVYGEVKSLSIAAPASITANETTKKTVTVTALDEFGNKVVGFDEQTVVLSGVGVTVYDAENAAAPAGVASVDGVATFQIDAAAALAGEDIVLTATFGEITANVTVQAVAPVATAVKVVTASSDSYLAANKTGTANVQVQVVDQENVAFAGTYEVKAAITGPATLNAATATYSGSPVTFTISNATSIGAEGSNVLTFSVEGLTSASHTIKQVIAGNPAKLAVSVAGGATSKKATETFSFNVQVQDRNGVPVVLYDAAPVTLEFTLPDNTPVVATGSIDANSPNGTFTLAVDGAQAFTGDVTVAVKAAANGYSLNGSKTVSFVPGDVTDVSIDRTEAIEVPVANPTASYTFAIVDANGNAVPKSGVELTVYGLDLATGLATDALTINGAKTSTKVTTNAEGKATVTLAARPYTGKTYTVYAEDADGHTSDVGSMTVLESVASSITTRVKKAVDASYIAATSVKAGETYYVIANVKDNYGTALTGLTLDGSAAKILGDGAGSLTDTVTFVEYNALNATHVALGMAAGDYVATVIGGKAGLATVNAEYNGTQTPVTKSASITVRAGDLAKIAANGGKALEIKAGEISNGITLQLADAYGNAVYSNTAKTISWTVSGADVTLRTTAGGATATSLSTKGAATVYVVASPAATGSYTISFTDGVETGSLTVNIAE